MVKKKTTIKKVSRKTAPVKRKSAAKKKAVSIKKVKKGNLTEVVHVLRKEKKTTIALIARNGAGYPAFGSGKKWEYAKTPAIKARGEDFDPNRPKFFFDHRGIDVLGVFDIAEGALVVYQSAHTDHGNYHTALGAALFDVIELSWKETWRTELPIFEGDIPLYAKGADIVSAKATLKGDMIQVQWKSSQENTYSFEFPQPFKNLHPDPKNSAILTRHEGNPVVTANAAHDWEAIATLNPAAVLVDGQVHLFYRAIGYGGRSVFGHAVSSDGLNFRRFEEPSYIPGEQAKGARSPRRPKKAIPLRCPASGIDGAEDPRATVLEGEVHILYAAFNGWEQARTAHISAPLDGLNENALDWNEPTLLSKPPTHWGTGGKNAALLPKKIDGRYVIFHRIWPDICIDYTWTLDMSEFRDDNTRWLEPKRRIKVRPAHWDSGKILVGAPPLETKDGWLLIYNAVSHQHNGGGYKIGAMLLDKDDPSTVLYRSKQPILTSQMWYEETGLTPRVTYACGAVIKDGTLFVYYGGADTYVNVATAGLDEFLKKLKQDEVEQQRIIESR